MAQSGRVANRCCRAGRIRDGLTNLLVITLSVVFFLASVPLEQAKTADGGAGDKINLTEDQTISHLLSRMTYGARPGDFDRVRRMGITNFIKEQLHPDQIEDPLVPDKLKAFELLSKRPYELVDGNDGKPKNVGQELQQAKLIRAIYSERQLNEIMVEFWLNHFNVFINKGADKFLMPAYERDAIRPYAMGKFKNLLLATASNPAMLFYLDNWQSSTPNPPPPAPRNAGNRAPFGIPRVNRPFGGIPLPPAPKPGNGNNKNKKKNGINENYAREIMELHTLGVDGGYTQKDVTEVARCLTGWTIKEPRGEGSFIFKDEMHDRGPKLVLGHTIDRSGMKDGLEVIDLLAHETNTAKFISTKLVRRFVSDEPPASLVSKVSDVFVKTDGDIRQMLATIFTSPEFYAPEAYKSKMKTPLELAVSAIRAVGAESTDTLPIARQIGRMGMPLYQAQPPTGYPDTAQAWINTGLLLERVNYGLQLASNKLNGTTVDIHRLIPGGNIKAPETVTDHLIKEILHTDISAQTREALSKPLPESLAAQITDGGPPKEDFEVVKTVAMLLGSPEFQKR